MTNYFFSRIKRSELKDIHKAQERLLKKPEILNYNHYDSPTHLNWLKNALKEAKKQKRICFGAYYYFHREQASKLVASVILKKDKYSNILEIKNLFIYEDFFNRLTKLEKIYEEEKKIIEREIIIMGLLDKVERFALKRNIKTLEIEVPFSKREVVNACVRKEYKIISSSESKYLSSKGNYIYKARRDIVNNFLGDPYSYDHILTWILKSYFNAGKRIEKLNIIHPRQGLKSFLKGYRFTFSIPSILTDDTPHFLFNGEIRILDGSERDRFLKEWSNSDGILPLEKWFDDSTQLKMLFLPENNDHLKKKCEKLGIHFFIRKDIRAFLGTYYPEEILKESEIGGFLIEVDNVYRYQALKQQTNFKHIIFNGIGSHLLNLIHSGKFLKNYYLFFYSSDFEGSEFERGIWGYSLIVGGYEDTKSTLDGGEYYQKFNFLFDKNEFEYYAAYYEADTPVTVLEIKPSTNHVNSPLNIIELSSDKMKEDLKKSQENANLNNIYLDITTVSNLLKESKKKEPSVAKTKKNVFLSYNRKEVDQVRELRETLETNGIPIWIDESGFKPGDEWINKLEETLTKTEIAIICIGENGVGRWQNKEIFTLQILSAKNKDVRIIPLLLPGEYAPRIPPFLESYQRIDCQNGFSEELLDGLVEMIIDGFEG